MVFDLHQYKGNRMKTENHVAIFLFGAVFTAPAGATQAELEELAKTALDTELDEINSRNALGSDSFELDSIETSREFAQRHIIERE